MNRREFLSLLCTLPLLRRWAGGTSTPAFRAFSAESEGWINALPWQCSERVMQYDARDGMYTTVRYVAHDRQWTYELTAQEDAAHRQSWVQEIRKQPRRAGGLV